MEFIENVKSSDFYKKTRKFCRKAGKVIRRIVGKIMHYRAVFLAALVVLGAVFLAVLNMSNLPEQVGIKLLSDGSFTYMVPKLLAVLVPFLITLVSLVFLLISKRTLFPWLISMFTLMIPLIILVTNIFPA